MNEPSHTAAPNPFQSPGELAAEVEVRPEIVGGGASTWPTVLGIVGIAFGLFGAMGGVAGVVVNLVMVAGEGFFADTLRGGPDAPPTVDVALKYAGLNAALSTGAACLALWLLAAGVMILQRRPASRMVVLGWAMAKIMLVLLMSGVQVVVQLDTLGAMREIMPDMDMMGPVFWGVAIVSALFNLVWGAALPVFVLVWFARARIKAEVAAWH